MTRIRVISLFRIFNIYKNLCLEKNICGRETDTGLFQSLEFPLSLNLQFISDTRLCMVTCCLQEGQFTLLFAVFFTPKKFTSTYRKYCFSATLSQLQVCCTGKFELLYMPWWKNSYVTLYVFFFIGEGPSMFVFMKHSRYFLQNEDILCLNRHKNTWNVK